MAVAAVDEVIELVQGGLKTGGCEGGAKPGVAAALDVLDEDQDVGGQADQRRDQGLRGLASPPCGG